MHMGKSSKEPKKIKDDIHWVHRMDGCPELVMDDSVDSIYKVKCLQGVRLYGLQETDV